MLTNNACINANNECINAVIEFSELWITRYDGLKICTQFQTKIKIPWFNMVQKIDMSMLLSLDLFLNTQGEYPVYWPPLLTKGCMVKIINKRHNRSCEKGWFTNTFWYKPFLVSLDIRLLCKREIIKALKILLKSESSSVPSIVI